MRSGAGAAGFGRLGPLVLLATVVIACGSKPETAGDVALQLTMRPDPPEIGKARLVILLSDAGGRPVSGAKLRFEANMTHPGMAPELGAAREAAPGRYEAELELTMAGAWFVIVEGTLSDGRTLRRQLDLPQVHAR